MGCVSSSFFCKSFQLSKDDKEITNSFYVLYRIQIQIQMLHMTKSLFLKILICKLFVCRTVLKCHDMFWSRVDSRTSKGAIAITLSLIQRQ